MGEPQNPHLYDLDFWTCPWLPKPIIYIFGDTRKPKKKQDHHGYFESYGFCCCRNLEVLEIRMFESFGKDRCRTIPKIRLINSSKSWIRDRYLSNNMKWKFGNMGSLNLRHFETKKLWNQEKQDILKPINQETNKTRNRTKQDSKKPRNFFK